jgi:hypothetical protein
MGQQLTVGLEKIVKLVASASYPEIDILSRRHGLGARFRDLPASESVRQTMKESRKARVMQYYRDGESDSKQSEEDDHCSWAEGGADVREMRKGITDRGAHTGEHRQGSTHRGAQIRDHRQERIDRGE